MRLWYWFLLILLIVGLVLLFVAAYYIYILEEYEFGWELGIYGSIILGFLVAVAALYFERWRRRWWER
jgi:cell division protein FtsW (lipid II flippase)